MPIKPETIAALLGVFFIIAAIIKGIAASHHRRKMANIKAAQASGGTEESPVQLFDPFSEQKNNKPAAPQAQPAAAQEAKPATPAAPPPPKPAAPQPPVPKAEKSPYVWE